MRIEGTDEQMDALCSIVMDWICDGFTTPPYPDEYYDVYEALGLSNADFEYVIYDINRPK